MKHHSRGLEATVAAAALAGGVFFAVAPAQADMNWTTPSWMEQPSACANDAALRLNHAYNGACLVDADAQDSVTTAEADMRTTREHDPRYDHERVEGYDTADVYAADADTPAADQRMRERSDRDAAMTGSNEPRTSRMETASAGTYTVKDGDTLWDIAESRLGEGPEFREIADANSGKIDDPDLIYPGQELTIPEESGSA